MTKNRRNLRDTKRIVRMPATKLAHMKKRMDKVAGKKIARPKKK